MERRAQAGHHQHGGHAVARTRRRRSASRRAPAWPSRPPSTEASTSVRSDERPSNTRASSISAAVSAALPARSGGPGASRAATTTTCSRRRPGRRPTTLTRSRPWLRSASRSTAKPRSLKVVGHQLGGGRRRPACPARRFGARSAMRVGGDRGLAAVEEHVGRQTLRQRARAALQREHRQHHREEGRDERRAVDAGLYHCPQPTICRCLSRHRGSCWSMTSSRSRSCSPSLLQGGLRGRGRPGRPGGARPAERGLLRPRRPRPDAAEGRRLRGLPPAAGPQQRADHHAHREGRGDRQGARPGAGRRRLHHQALLPARVPQPGEGGAAARRAWPARRTRPRSRSSTATCASTSSGAAWRPPRATCG